MISNYMEKDVNQLIQRSLLADVSGSSFRLSEAIGFDKK